MKKKIKQQFKHLFILLSKSTKIFIYFCFSTKINLFNTLVDGKQVNTVIRDTCNKNKKFYQYDLTKNLFR